MKRCKDFWDLLNGIADSSRIVEFQWDSSCEESFQLLRKALINHPVLAYPDFTKPLRLTTDASGTGLGAVLKQDQDGGSCIIACASRTLSAPERNYSVTERECLGVVWATDKVARCSL